MLARRSQLKLPDGQDVDLPLLVPSFSSKGFGLVSMTRSKRRVTASVVSGDLRSFGETPSVAVLISAFDLHFDHFQLPEAADGNCLNWLPNARIIFLDSGGYELAPDFDSSEPKTPPYSPRDGFGRPEYLAVLQTAKKRFNKCNFVVSNYDWGTRGKPLMEQITDARTLKRRAAGALFNFIIKPWSPSMTVVDPRKMSAENIADLAGFDIIGVTEKELGADFLDRLKRVAQLRAALDVAKISAPIHVWGGLDPILTPLYFFAGAQIFDGLSWLRYAFVDGLAVNRECAAALDEGIGIDAQKRFAHPMTAFRNRRFLEQMTGFLQQWVDFDGSNFTMFPSGTRDHLARAYKTMQTKIPELKAVRHGG
ncbi:MAG: hypothetical protein KJZ69_17690 [Phycisphaerales bacterium]|nr:hypothetical protein [Phycisphaerales bacterium]